ncbi:hypothetical protein IC230_15915 [Spirosoma sp. BT704]|uniref:Uncharacterized protein n=2 Tax=Spirosoma validum TaxID=2771355 RepID=A0A927B2X5_9BACT|nr:hypothetical protein [Spirosoma validum]
MKGIPEIIGFILLLCLAQSGLAQSTTGGRSGGSTASTGAGYLTPGKRPAETSAASMTIADEGASRAYMYVPPVPAAKAKNQSASPDGSDSSTTGPSTPQSTSTPHQSAGKKSERKPNLHQ